MTKELIDSGINNEASAEKGFDWQDYEPYKWFMEQVGGPDKMIPREDGLSWMLRIHHREYTKALKINPRIGSDSMSLIKSIDEFYKFKTSNAKRYATGTAPTGDANPADSFFKRTAVAGDPEALQKLQESNIEQILSNSMDLEGFRKLSGLKKLIAEKALRFYFEATQRKVIKAIILDEIKVKFLGK